MAQINKLLFLYSVNIGKLTSVYLCSNINFDVALIIYKMYNMCGHYFVITITFCDVRMVYWSSHMDHTIQMATIDGTQHKVFINNASDSHFGEICEITNDAEGIVFLPDVRCISFKLKLSFHI